MAWSTDQWVQSDSYCILITLALCALELLNLIPGPNTIIAQ